MDDIQSLSASLLTDAFRNLCASLGATTDPDEKKFLSRKADVYEEELLRRISW